MNEKEQFVENNVAYHMTRWLNENKYLVQKDINLFEKLCEQQELQLREYFSNIAYSEV